MLCQKITCQKNITRSQYNIVLHVTGRAAAIAAAERNLHLHLYVPVVSSGCTYIPAASFALST
jgi:hypothetical protein